MSSEFFFAAMMPATCATASTSPFFIFPSRTSANVSALRWTTAPAVAVRSVMAFSLTSTMRARPSSLKCVSSMIYPPIAFMPRRLSLTAPPSK